MTYYGNTNWYTQYPNDYFGERKPALGKIQKWDNYPSRDFPYETSCEECGWLINITDTKIVNHGGFHGKNHYHKECWDIKSAEHRTSPRWTASYGFRQTRRKNGGFHTQTDMDWVWSPEHERFEKPCKMCNKMMCVFTREYYKHGNKRLSNSGLYNKYRDICGHCKRYHSEVEEK